MGIGGGIFLITIGAILAFGVNAEPGWLDLDVVGTVLILAGITVIALTWWFWRDRRRRGPLTEVQTTLQMHQHHPISADLPRTARMPEPPSPPL